MRTTHRLRGKLSSTKIDCEYCRVYHHCPQLLLLLLLLLRQATMPTLAGWTESTEALAVWVYKI